MKLISTKRIDITPDRSLMPKLGRAGYSTGEAISELVDNSVDARIPGEFLTVKIIINKNYIEISDDGSGMDEKTAANSLRLAHSTKKNQLGEYGLGLKTACQSLGEKFSITTKKLGSEEEYYLEFDEKEWIEKGDWKDHKLELFSSEKNKGGTTIRIEKLKIKYYDPLVTILKKVLSERFGPYMENNELDIIVNTKKCLPIKIELTGEGKIEFKKSLSNGVDIFGWAGLAKTGEYSGNKGYYGFNTYRKGRLITKYDKIGFEPHPQYRRVIGELHIEGVPVTHNKREWIKESGEFEEVVAAMKEIVKPLLVSARNYEVKNEVSPILREKVEEQIGYISKALRKIPELKFYSLPKEERKGKTEIEIEKRNPSIEPVLQEYTEPESTKDRTPKNTHRKRTFSLNLNGRNYKFFHDFSNLGDTKTMWEKHVSEEKGVEVYTNIDFPAYPLTKDSLFYSVLNIAEAIAEVIVEKNNEPLSKVIHFRNLILEKYASISRDLKDFEKKQKEIEEKQKELEELKLSINGDEDEGK